MQRPQQCYSDRVLGWAQLSECGERSDRARDSVLCPSCFRLGVADRNSFRVHSDRHRASCPWQIQIRLGEADSVSVMRTLTGTASECTLTDFLGWAC